jgi:hypothetical protein
MSTLLWKVGADEIEAVAPVRFQSDQQHIRIERTCLEDGLYSQARAGGEPARLGPNHQAGRQGGELLNAGILCSPSYHRSTEFQK